MQLLLAVDDSDSARVAVSFVSKLKPPDRLLLLHVVDVARHQHPSIPSGISKSYFVRLEGSLVRSGKQLLNKMKSAFPSDFPAVETAVLVGSPAKTILEMVEKRNPDLLVLGSRGLDRLQQWVLGSVSYEVASRASCPVLVVKRAVRKLEKVLLAYDGSDEADRAADFLKRGLFEKRVELTIAGVWPRRPVPPKLAAAAELLRKRAQQAGTELAEKVRRGLPAGRFMSELQMVEGDPAETIVGLVTERHMDLVVMGARRMGRLKRLFLGSVSHTVLQRAPCAVLIVREE
jgi:nucleotide-binding universal stress UspA family protein